MVTEEHFQQVLKQYEDYAEKNGFHLNSDSKVVRHLINALLQREERYGKRYCPCRRLKENQDENDKIVCPCVYHKEEIERDGHCHCLLFVK